MLLGTLGPLPCTWSTLRWTKSNVAEACCWWARSRGRRQLVNTRMSLCRAPCTTLLLLLFTLSLLNAFNSCVQLPCPMGPQNWSFPNWNKTGHLQCLRKHTKVKPVPQLNGMQIKNYPGLPLNIPQNIAQQTSPVRPLNISRISMRWTSMLPWAAPYCYAAALPSVTAGGEFWDIVFNRLAVFPTDQSMNIENKLTKQHQ